MSAMTISEMMAQSSPVRVAYNDRIFTAHRLYAIILPGLYLNSHTGQWEFVAIGETVEFGRILLGIQESESLADPNRLQEIFDTHIWKVGEKAGLSDYSTLT